MAGTWVVDSIEDGVAALAGPGMVIHITATLLPAGVGEGDLIELSGDERSGYQIRIQASAGSNAAIDARRRLDDLSLGDPGGDLRL